MRNHKIAYLLLIILAMLSLTIPRYLFPMILETDVPLDVVESGSMEHELHIGDLLISQGMSADKLEEGLIIVFKRPSANYLIVHRIYRLYGHRIITKGDMNAMPDPFYITSRDIRGVVIARIPLVGYLTLLFRTR